MTRATTVNNNISEDNRCRSTSSSSLSCPRQQRQRTMMTSGKLTTTTMTLLSMSSFVLLLVSLVVVQGTPASALTAGATSTEDLIITEAAVTASSSIDDEKDDDIYYYHDDDDLDVLDEDSSSSSEDQDVEYRHLPPPPPTVALLSSSSSTDSNDDEDEEGDTTKKNVVVFVRPSKNNHAQKDEDEYYTSFEEEEQDEEDSMMLSASTERNRHLSSANVAYERLMQDYFENTSGYNSKWNGPGITFNSNLAYGGSGSQLLNINRVLELKSSDVMNGSTLDYTTMKMQFKFRGLGWQEESRNTGRLNVQMSYNSGSTWAMANMAHIIYGNHFENGQWMDGEVIIYPWGSRDFIEKDKLLFKFFVANASTNGEKIYIDSFTLDGEVYEPPISYDEPTSFPANSWTLIYYDDFEDPSLTQEVWGGTVGNQIPLYTGCTYAYGCSSSNPGDSNSIKLSSSASLQMQNQNTLVSHLSTTKQFTEIKLEFKYKGIGFSASTEKLRINVHEGVGENRWRYGQQTITYITDFTGTGWQSASLILNAPKDDTYYHSDKVKLWFELFRLSNANAVMYIDNLSISVKGTAAPPPPPTPAPVPPPPPPPATSWGPWKTISNEIFNYQTTPEANFDWSVDGSQSFPSSGGETGYTITPIRSLEMTNGATTTTTWKPKLGLHTGEYNQVQVIVWFNFYKLAAGDQLVLESSNNNGYIWRFANSWNFDTLRNGQHDTMITTFTEGASGPNLAWSSSAIKFQLKAVGLTSSNYIYIDRVLIRGRKWMAGGTPTAGDEYYGSPEPDMSGPDAYDPNGGYSVENNGPLVVSARTGSGTTATSPHRGRGRIPSAGRFPSAADKLTTSDSGVTKKKEEPVVVEEEEEPEDEYDYDEYYYVAEMAEPEPYIAPEAFNVHHTSDGPLIIESSTSSITPPDDRRRHLDAKQNNKEEDVVVRRDHAKRRGLRQR